jgi:hypothetical protein
MTGKERVIKTINHGIPDRVPVGEWGIDHDHVSRIIGHPTYWRNRKDETIALWEGRRDEVVESLKNDCVELVEKLDYDIITVGLVPPRGYRVADPPRKIADGLWEDSKGNRYKYAASNDSIMSYRQSPAREEVSDEEIEAAIKELKDIDDSRFELVSFIGERYGRDKAVLFRGIDIYGNLMNHFGGDQTHQLIMPLLAPDQIKRWHAYAVARNKLLIERCTRHNVLICMQGYDFGMNTSTIMSPAVLRDIFFPLMADVNQLISANGMIPFYHCCGNIWEIMDDFVAAGYRGYQSIQESAGMDNARVKMRYGDKLTMWTGVQCETLISGTLAETRAEVSRNLELLMPGGGFIFGSTNSVQYGAKTDNYLAALDVVRKKGVYATP